MDLEKKCAECGKTFAKPYAEGRPAWSRRKFCSLSCKSAAQIGQPGTRLGQGGGPGSLGGLFIPCRICGTPTKYRGTPQSKLYGLVNCGLPACRNASKALRYSRLSSTRADKVAKGEWKIMRDNWLLASQVTSEENALAPFMSALGFTPQHKVLTGSHSIHEARYYKLDFAHLPRRLCVEIDGSSHRLPRRRERDDARDAFMLSIGWRTLRILASDVVKDQSSVESRIKEFYLRNY